ncbi:MAG: HAD-IIA family hydrolase [Anaerolineae bacterium]
MRDLTEISGFLLDMDGTLYLSNRLLPGAADFVTYLEESGTPYLLLTNNSSRSSMAYVQKLARLGLTVPPERILTSGSATAQYLRDETPYRRPALFGTPELVEEFEAFGFAVVFDEPDAVVLGFDTTLTYERLTRLCDLVRAGLPYIATHPDFNCPVEGGFIPDIGATIAFVEASTGRRPDVIIGKPSRTILEMAAARMGLPLEGLCMVGDRMYTDIAMGRDAPIQTVLVLSGETRLADLEGSPYLPDHVYPGVGDLLAALRKIRAGNAS